jgi:hypothetical protein
MRSLFKIDAPAENLTSASAFHTCVRVLAQPPNFSLCCAVNREIDPQGRDTLNSHLKIFAVVAAMALLVPAGAAAKRAEDKPDKGNKHGKAHKQGKAKTPKVKLATANVKGTVQSNDGSTMTVVVSKASGHVKACNGATLSFDVADARFHTADNDADGDMDAADVLVDHDVKVRAKVTRTKGKKTSCSALEGVIAAKAVHNRTTPKVDDDSEELEEEVVEDEQELEEDEQELEEDEQELEEDDLGDF